jgi:replication factor A1
MDLERIIQRILLVRRDLTREEVLKKIYNKKRSAKGYLLDETAARIVASELGVKIPARELEPSWVELSIGKLVSGLNDVTITGRVIIVHSVQTFPRPHLAEGKVARLLIADKTGSIQTVLWDDKATLVETRKIAAGQIIRVLHGYVREGRNGKLELHVGGGGEIQVSPSDVDEREYPSIDSFIEKIGAITSKHKMTNIQGVVQRVHKASDFERTNGTRGKVRRIQLGDETGRITVVFWNQKVDELGQVQEGDCLRLMNARVKGLVGGLLELHVEKATQIEKITEKSLRFSAFQPRLAKIKELEPKMRSVSVLAKVVDVEGVKEFKRPGSDVGHVSTLHLQDETGSIQLNLWEEKASFVNEVKPGDIVLVEKAYTRLRFGKVQLNLGKRGKITLNPPLPESKKLPPLTLERTRKISEITESGGPFVIEATVLTAPTIREVTTSRNEKIKVASFDITDGTGRIGVSLWRRHAEFAKGLSIGTRILLKNVYAKKGFADQLELTTRTSTKLEIISDSETKEPS